RLLTRGTLSEDGEALGFSFSSEITEAIAAFMAAHPEERGERDEAAVHAAYGERYGAAFLAAVEGSVPGFPKEAGIEAGVNAVLYLLAARAFSALAGLLGEAARAANDAAIVGPVVASIEAAGGLSGITDALRARADALGEA